MSQYLFFPHSLWSEPLFLRQNIFGVLKFSHLSWVVSLTFFFRNHCEILSHQSFQIWIELLRPTEEVRGGGVFFFFFFLLVKIEAFWNQTLIHVWRWIWISSSSCCTQRFAFFFIFLPFQRPQDDILYLQTRVWRPYFSGARPRHSRAVESLRKRLFDSGKRPMCVMASRPGHICDGLTKCCFDWFVSKSFYLNQE